MPRAAYVMHLPALLLVTALITWIAGDEIALVIASTVGGGVGLYILWDWLFREAPTRFSTLSAMSFLIGYGLGALNTWLTLPRGGLSLAQYMGKDPDVLARGMAGVLIASAPLIFLGELYERPLFGRDFRISLDQRTCIFIVLGTGVVLVGFLTHSLGFMGTELSAGEQMSVATALITGMFACTAALSIPVFLVVRGRLLKPVMGFCSLVLCTLVMVLSRRTIFYTAVLALFSLRFIGYRLKGTLLRKFLLISGGAIFLAVGLNVFMLLRLAGFQTGRARVPLFERVRIAASWVEDGSALSRATEANQANVRSRTFILGFFADVLDGSTRETPALGEDFKGLTQMAIPKVLYPDKYEFGEEGLADMQFGLTYSDAANSILTNGATDFGIVGAIAYPLLLVGLLRFIFSALSWILPPFPASFIALEMIGTVLQTEIAITGYLVAIRNVIIFAAILWVFYSLPAFSLRSRGA